MKRMLWLLAALAVGVATFVVWKTRLFQVQTVYVRNIPHVSFLGHVAKTNGNLQLMKNFPLYDDDARDGIWGTRLGDLMEEINFHARIGSRDKHGILLYTYKRQWRVIWFDFALAQRGHKGRLEWNLVTVDPETFLHRPNWNFANGETELFSREEILSFGIKDLLDLQNRADKTDEHNAEAFKRHDEEQAAKAKRKDEAAKKVLTEP